MVGRPEDSAEGRRASGATGSRLTASAAAGFVLAATLWRPQPPARRPGRH